MARPPLPEYQLKHPRTKRKSTTVAQPLENIPEPSQRAKKRWAKVVMMCCNAVLTNEPLHTLPIKNKVRIKFKKLPTGFPKGRIIEKCSEHIVYEYNAEIVLTWLYERKLSPYSPSMLYKSRMGLLMSINKLLDGFEIEAYNVNYQLED